MDTKKPSERSRVKVEVQDMYQQLLLGSLFATILRVLIDVIGILLALGFTYSSLLQLFPAEPCVRACFEGQTSIACWSSLTSIIWFCVLLTTLAVGSFVSTYLKKIQKFQHSSSVTGGLLTVIIVSQLWNSYPIGIILLTLLAVFTSTYLGYSMWFFMRDRKKNC